MTFNDDFRNDFNNISDNGEQKINSTGMPEGSGADKTGSMNYGAGENSFIQKNTPEGTGERTDIFPGGTEKSGAENILYGNTQPEAPAEAGRSAEPFGGQTLKYTREEPCAGSQKQASVPDYSAAAGEKTYFGGNYGGQRNENPYMRENGGNGNYSEQRSAGSGQYSGSYSQQGGNYANAGEGRTDNASAGIRYDADKKSGDGAYTWNYAKEREGSGENSPWSRKADNGKKQGNGGKKHGYTVFIAAAMAFIVLGTAVVSSVVTSGFIRSSAAKKADEAEANKPVIGQSGGTGGGTENMVTVPSPSNGAALTKQQIAEKCKPSSVGIQTVVTTQGFYGYTYKTGGVGSGFILTEDGYIATNHHVIENADTITVQLDDGTQYEAVLVGSDSVTDLAVLKIEAVGLIPMEIGDSDKMVVGDSVIAIGTPAGIEFAGTVTDGIISAINRGVEITNERGGVAKRMTLMQTNAAINPGNSGGPLINDKGEVIGINTLKLTSTYEGIGFSIPINSAVAIFNQLITDGKVSDYDSSFVTGNGSIGITNYVEISEQEAEYYNVPAGIVILQLDIDSGAYAAGLKRYDTIIGFQGKEVRTVAQLNEIKSDYKAGDEVTLRVFRDGVGEMDITFKLDLMG